MKKVKQVFSVILFTFTTVLSFSQTLNFGNLKREDKHIVTINTGLEYGLIFGAGYGYHLKSKWPIILNAEFSLPSGGNLLDDFKTKIGGQIRIFQNKNFHFTGKVQGIFRSIEDDYVRLLNFGSDVSGTIGYFKPKWFVAAEIGFDKAIVTHFKHSVSYKEIYPMVQDGWYEPPTGGHFYYGFLLGYSFKNSDIYVKAGKTDAQGLSNNPLGFYGQLGYTFRFNQYQRTGG